MESNAFERRKGYQERRSALPRALEAHCVTLKLPYWTRGRRLESAFSELTFPDPPRSNRLIIRVVMSAPEKRYIPTFPSLRFWSNVKQNPQLRSARPDVSTRATCAHEREGGRKGRKLINPRRVARVPLNRASVRSFPKTKLITHRETRAAHRAYNLRFINSGIQTHVIETQPSSRLDNGGARSWLQD